MKLLTIPWWGILLGMLWIVNNHPEWFGSLMSVIMACIIEMICLIMIPAAFMAAHECKCQDEEVIRLRAKK